MFASGTRCVGVATVLLPLVAAQVWCADVQACEPYPCLPGSLLPAGGTIPANTPELRWHSGEGSRVKSPKRHLQLRRGTKKVPFTVEPLANEQFRIRVGEPLVEGATYTLTADNLCTYVGPKTIASTFSVGPEAPLPTELGRVTLASSTVSPLKIGTTGGSCNVQEKAAWADVEVSLSPSAAPWKDLIDYTVQVDGRGWRFAETIGRPPPPGQSVIGRGRARIYARCEDPSAAFEGAGEGSHKVALRGSVFASGDALVTPTVALGLSCRDGVTMGPSDGPHPATAPATEVSPNATTPTEAATGSNADAKSSAGGAAKAPAAPSAAVPPATGTDPHDSPGALAKTNGGCAVTRGGDLGFALACLVLGLVIVRRPRAHGWG